MRKCCKCKSLVWFWQHSNLAGGVIHAKCHEKLIADKIKNNPDLKSLYEDELKCFTSKTGLKPF